MDQSRRWICCQLGAREYYAIPRALHQAGQLNCLLTDAWVKPDSLFKKFPIQSLKSLGDRHHPELDQATVHAFTPEFIFFEAQHRLQKTAAWSRMIARNHWFQAKVIQQLKQLPRQNLGRSPILFTYSYAALDILKYAKSQGWTTILGQIDPGIEEEKIVQAEFNRYPDLAPDWQPVPPEYWENWRQECELSDYILVNSQWSKQLLIQGGISAEKTNIVPLIYQPPENAQYFTRQYPAKFTAERPLRVLFLGLVTLRKGIAACLDAIQILEGKPIEFWFVGSLQIKIPEKFKNHPQIRWVGHVPRSQTQPYYQQADVFLFPTLSDGFGLTQLEALAWQLPLIKTEKCGSIDMDNTQQIILEEANATKISNILLSLLDTNYLQSLSFQEKNDITKNHNLNILATTLINLI